MKNNITSFFKKNKKAISSIAYFIGSAIVITGATIFIVQSIEDHNKHPLLLKESHDISTKNYFSKNWLKSANDEELRRKKLEIQYSIDWSGSILDGDYNSEIDALDSIDEELNQRAWKRYNSTPHTTTDYGIHREHGWYLRNDD